MSELKAYIAPTADGTGLAEYYLKSEADKVIARNKYKRCLAMAKWCYSEMDFWYDSDEIEQNERFKFYEKWRQRWLKLAEVFK